MSVPVATQAAGAGRQTYQDQTEQSLPRFRHRELLPPGAARPRDHRPVSLPGVRVADRVELLPRRGGEHLAAALDARLLSGAARGASRIYQALRITMFITAVGTALSLLATAGLAYGLAQHGVPGRGLLLFYVFFTMLFGGGMVPFYLVVSWLGLVNTVWALIIPMMVNPWNMFIMMKFFEAIPADLQDAARIDGCSELGIFWRVIIPLSMPVMATIGLFYAVDYWNEWFWATIFISKAELMPLQLVLRGILSQLLQVLDPQAAVDQAQMAQQVAPPVEVLRMAAIVVSILPITLVYPFLQRYFVKGVLIGAIKG